MVGILIKKAKELRIILLVILTILTGYVLWKNFQDLPSIINFNYIGIFWCIIFYNIYLVITSYRHYHVLRFYGLSGMQPIKWFKVYVAGRFFNKFIPQSGNVYRGVFLKSLNKFPYTKYITSLTVLAWIDLILSLSMSLVVVLIFESDMMIGSYKTSTIFSLSLLIVLMLPFMIRYVNSYLKKQSIQFIPNKIEAVATDITGNITNIKVPFLLKNIFFGIIAVIITVISFYFAFYILGLNPGFTRILIYVSFVRLLLVYNITPGNFGIQEIGFGVLTELTDLGISAGIYVSIIIRLNAYFSLFVITTLYMLETKKINNSVTK